MLLTLALVLRALASGVSFASFAMLLVALVLVGAGAVALYLAWACLTLRYTLDQGTITIRWGLTRHEAPVAIFERVVRGRATARLALDGLDLPGCHAGTAILPRVGRVTVISLHQQPSEALFLLGPEGSYAVSVANSAAFIHAIQGQISAPSRLDTPRVVSPAPLAALPRDSAVLSALGSALVLALIATGIIFSRYAGFPDEIVMNFPNEGRAGPRSALLGIPLAAWLLLVANGAAGLRLTTGHRTAAFTLLYGLALLEAFLVIAAATAV